MKKTLERLTMSQQVFPTASSAISGSAVVGMDQYRHAVVRLTAHRLPDQKGEGVGTVSLYETTNTVLNGSEIAASVVTGSITSASDVVLQAEIAATDLTDTYKNVYAYWVGPTATRVECSIIRDEKRYET